jgi:hypothetical protein
MRTIIENLVSNITVGLAFDAHFIIDTVIMEHSDSYLAFAEIHPAHNKRTEYLHSELSKIIASFEGSLVERMNCDSLSYNIRGKASNCKLWKRIT